MQKITVSSQPQRNDDTFVLVYGWCVRLLIYIYAFSWQFYPKRLTKSFLATGIHSRTLLTAISTLFISYVSSVVNRMLKNLHVSCTDPLVPKFPSEGNIYRPQYPSRLHKGASWSQISCVVSFPPKKNPDSLYHIVILIKWWNADMRKATGIFILQLLLFPWRTHTHTLWEGASSIKP